MQTTFRAPFVFVFSGNHHRKGTCKCRDSGRKSDVGARKRFGSTDRNKKNVCDSLIGTLFNINMKTKDGLNARLDLIEMNIRGNLAPIEMGKRTYCPQPVTPCQKYQKVSFCQCLKGVKVSQGHSSNVKSLLSMQDLKLIGLKSYDCHILMQQLLPITIRGILPENVRHTITCLCSFFSSICCKVIDPLLDDL